MSQNYTQTAPAVSLWSRIDLQAYSRPVLVLSTLYLLLPFVMYFAPQGLAIWVMLTIFAAPSPSNWLNALRTLRLGPGLGSIILLVVWACISLVWSPTDTQDHVFFLSTLVVFGAIFIATMRALSDRDRLQVRHVTIVSVIIAAALMLTEALTNYGLNRVILGHDIFEAKQQAERSVGVLVAISWPLLGVLAVGRGNLPFWSGTLVVCFALCAFAFAAFQLQGFPSLAAFTLGGFALLVVHTTPRFGLTVIGAAALVYLFLAPVLHMIPITQLLDSPSLQLPLSWEYRLQIWGNAAQAIYQQPVAGLGFDAAHTLGDAALQMRGMEWPAMPLHSQNMVLQIWLELGLVGISLIAVLFVSLLSFIWYRMRFPLQAGLLTAALVSYSLEAVLGFGTWDTWWIATAWITAGTALFAPQRM